MILILMYVPAISKIPVQNVTITCDLIGNVEYYVPNIVARDILNPNARSRSLVTVEFIFHLLCSKIFKSLATMQGSY